MGIIVSVAFYMAGKAVHPDIDLPPQFIEKCVITKSDLERAEEKCAFATSKVKALEASNSSLHGKVEEVVKEFWEFRGKVIMSEPDRSCESRSRSKRPLVWKTAVTPAPYITSGTLVRGPFKVSQVRP